MRAWVRAPVPISSPNEHPLNEHNRPFGCCFFVIPIIMGTNLVPNYCILDDFSVFFPSILSSKHYSYIRQGRMFRWPTSGYTSSSSGLPVWRPRRHVSSFYLRTGSEGRRGRRSWRSLMPPWEFRGARRSWTWRLNPIAKIPYMNKIVKIGIAFGAKWMAIFQARFDYQRVYRVCLW